MLHQAFAQHGIKRAQEVLLAQVQADLATQRVQHAGNFHSNVASTDNGDATGTYLALAYLHFFAGRHDQAEEEFKHVIDVGVTGLPPVAITI